MPAASSRTASKVQRWIDVLTALLSHNFAQTFAELAHGVPGYLADGSVTEGEPSASLKRMFERDKLELRTMGVPIETIGEEGDEESRYRLRTADFYLPYLEIASQRGTAKPKKVDPLLASHAGGDREATGAYQFLNSRSRSMVNGSFAAAGCH